ncbi:hypothetical protein [Mycoplasma miroungirhinis]|uniref:Uncharacterized protein n=1 Tax=Mycoplasma miroungirhinis TaxID=754516 RepID=A0A6M4JB76_9MOLU|nr:hypothetical protein [Mycoplasma miroungirhinis]QJR44253.1 hypothetical protein HLA92_02295 [Mycoplasma miroungirhinis]
MRENSVNFEEKLRENGYLTSWNIGTGIDLYFDKFINWANNNDLVQKMENKNNFNINLSNKVTENNKKTSFAFFEVDKNVVVYNDNEKTKGISDSTYIQCFRVLSALNFGIYNSDEKKFTIDKDKILDLNKLNKREKQERKIVKWICESLQDIGQNYNDKLSTFLNINQSQIETISDIKKFEVYISFLKEFILQQVDAIKKYKITTSKLMINMIV